MDDRSRLRLPVAVALIAAALLLPQTTAAPFVYETDKDLVTSADFDGNGLPDVALLDKSSGKYRLGFQIEPGIFNWVDFRSSGAKYVSGMAAGQILSSNHFALAVTSADESKLLVADISDPVNPGDPVAVSLEALGPNTVAAIPGEGPLFDLYAGSIYNFDPENLLSVIRWTGSDFTELSSADAVGRPARLNSLRFSEERPEHIVLLSRAEDGDSLQIHRISEGKGQRVAAADGFPAKSDYVAAPFRNQNSLDLALYVPGQTQLVFLPVNSDGAEVTFGERKAFEFQQAVQHVVVVAQEEAPLLFAIHTDGNSGGLYRLDPAAGLSILDTVDFQTNEVAFSAQPVGSGLLVFLSDPPFRASTRHQDFEVQGGKLVAIGKGPLPTLEDSDAWTVPEIHKLIVENLTEKSGADMRPYTNVIPGTSVKYAMVPIQGGEFTIGSPVTEEGRKPDEGPQRKVKIDPFWMGKFEVTWDEFEIFMFIEDDRKMREQIPLPPEVLELTDAVAHPSRPYVEMSFGMGRDRYPAISMTHYSATKFCQWLSARTGHFYRLPTEAEWEYAARAGTTTPYFFGTDPEMLKEYAVFDEFKYEKIGRKKANPWGLYDIYGNVSEWCLDGYAADAYSRLAEDVADNPWIPPTGKFPHAARGGSWSDYEMPVFRSAARLSSEPDWQARDPQLPKSRWWLTDAQFIGFRLVRPLKVPPADELIQYWTSQPEPKP